MNYKTAKVHPLVGRAKILKFIKPAFAINTLSSFTFRRDRLQSFPLRAVLLYGIWYDKYMGEFYYTGFPLWVRFHKYHRLEASRYPYSVFYHMGHIRFNEFAGYNYYNYAVPEG